MSEESIIQRLAFIQYLVGLGVQKSKEPEPFCWVSILNFHDSVELFLELALEKLKAKSRERSLLEDWEAINQILRSSGKNELTFKIQIEKLNKVRVNLKHYGTSPSKSAIEDARINVANFLEENTKTIFDMNFSDISLIDMIQCQSAKCFLFEAKQLLKEDKKEDAIDKIAIAFEELINDYEDRKRDTWGRSPFFFGEDLTFSSDEFIDRTILESIKGLQRALKITSFGIDYRKYSQFRLVTSRAIYGGKGNYSIQRLTRTIEEPNEDDIEFCIDFVIESAIILKEFDFMVKPKQRQPFKGMFNKTET
jgi:hypothetical protein